MDINAAIYDTNHNFFSAHTTEFLQAFLDIPSTCIDEVYAKLQATHFPNGLWADMPNPTDAPESAYYEPFTKIANDISDAVKVSSDFLQSTHVERVAGTWVHASNQTPEIFDPRTFMNRPDCMLITSSPTINLVDRALSDVEYDGNEGPSKEQYQTNQKETETLLKRWWRHVHVVVTIKTDTQVEDWEDAYLRLSQYMRCMLSQQFDRRSLFGIVLCNDQLAVVACDRSGLIRMFNPINIHTEARKFIQVIASFAYLPAHRLGWDPDMKIYDPKTDTQRPSYHIDTPDYILEQSYLTIHWCISIPTPEGAREDVITIRVLAGLRSEVMVGSATLVWQIIKYSDRHHISEDYNKMYVLKRYWRSLKNDELPSPGAATISAEAQRYRIIGDAKDRLYSYEDILIDGQVDSTSKYIRRDVEIIGGRPPHVTPLKTEQIQSHEKYLERERYHSHLTIVYADPDPFRSVDPKTIISRVHTQLVMPFFGESIRYFKSRLELLEVILAAVRDHEMFYGKGIVHRDVSIGNIVIIPKNSTVKGRLIDLDHAKVGTVTTITAVDASEDNIQYLTVVSKLKKTSALYHVDEDVIKLAAQTNLMDSERTIYIEHVIAMRQKFFDSVKPRQSLTLADMGWDKENHVLLDFSKRVVGSGGRTCTLPYMSAEVLGAQRFGVCSVPGDQPFFHDAVHDMESFMWVIANIFMTRKGPGINALRDELLSGSTKADVHPFKVALKNTLRDIFDSPDAKVIEEKKASFIIYPKLMESEVVAHFHPFFKSFGPMVLRWWNVLVIAYKFREHEYRNIHAHVIDILEKTIDDLKKIPTTSDETEAEKEEEERREKLRHNALLPFIKLSHAYSEHFPQDEDRGQMSK